LFADGELEKCFHFAFRHLRISSLFADGELENL